MEWTVKLEAKDGWGKVQTFVLGRVVRRAQGLTADEVGLMLDEAKTLLAELQRRMVETQIEEKIACIRVCTCCLRSQPIRDRRTRTLQTVIAHPACAEVSVTDAAASTRRRSPRTVRPLAFAVLTTERKAA